MHQVVPKVGVPGQALRGLLPGQGRVRVIVHAQARGVGPQQVAVQVGQVGLPHLAQVVPLQVVQGEGGAGLVGPTGQGAVHQFLRQVLHVVLVPAQGCPEDAQHGQGDRLFFGEDGQVQVAGAGPLIQGLHAHIQGGQQGGVLVAGEEPAEFLQVGLLQAAQGLSPWFGVLADEGAHHRQGRGR